MSHPTADSTTPVSADRDEYIGIPPPPPHAIKKRGRVSLLFVAGIVVLLGLLSASAILYYLDQSARASKDHSRPGILAPTSSTTPTQQPTVDPSYTATDIMSDFKQAGLRTSYTQYGVSIWSWSQDKYHVDVNATSSATWVNDFRCTGYCSPDSLGLWIYANPTDAQSAHDQVANDEIAAGSIPMMGTPTEFLHGRCLLLSTTPGSVYEQIVTQKCV